jgi:DNA-binding beta-propeller fold protein YncE
MRRVFFQVLAILIASSGSSYAQQVPAPHLQLIQTIAMPVGVSHFDHFGVDVKRDRLFATFEDKNTVEVFDLATGKNIHSIPGFHRPHNVLSVPDLDEIVITDGGGLVAFLNANSLKILRTVKLALNADFIGYDHVTKNFYITNGGHAAGMKYGLISIIDARGKHVDDIKVDGAHIEFLQMDHSSPRIYLSITDRNAVGVIDREKRQMVSTWQLPPGVQENIPLTLDENHHRLFTISRNPPELVVFDMETGKVVTHLPCASGSDDMSYDASRSRIYVPGRKGFISVFEQRDADHYEHMAEVPSGQDGATSIFVPELNRLYVGLRRSPSGALQVFEVQP